jgi:hypothetical protein
MMGIHFKKEAQRKLCLMSVTISPITEWLLPCAAMFYPCNLALGQRRAVPVMAG